MNYGTVKPIQVAPVELVDYLFGLFKIDLNKKIAHFREIKNYSDTFQLAIQEEQGGNLDHAKELLFGIREKIDFPKISEVNKELDKVNDQIAVKIKIDADAKVAAAQQAAAKAAAQAKAEAINRKKAQDAAAQAEANAAANQAAAEAAKQQAQQEQAAAQAAQAQAAASAQAAQQNAARIAAEANAAQDKAYLNSFANATTILLRCRQETSDSANAYIAGNTQTALNYLLLASNDCANVPSTLADPYPVKFQALNTAIINASKAYENGAGLHYKALIYLDKGMLSLAYSYYSQGEGYIQQIRNLLNSSF